MTNIQATLPSDLQQRMELIQKYRNPNTTNTPTSDTSSLRVNQTTPITSDLKNKKIKKEQSQELSLKTKIFTAVAAVLVGIVTLNNSTVNPNQNCQNSMATLYANCYPPTNLALGRLTGAQIETLQNRAEFPDYWSISGSINKLLAKFYTTGPLTSVIGNSLLLGAAEGEWPIALTPFATDDPQSRWSGWAPLAYFLKGQQPLENGGIEIHDTVQQQLKSLPQEAEAVANQFKKELKAACDKNQSTFNENLCFSHQWATSSIAQASSETKEKSIYRGSPNDPLYNARTQVSISVKEIHEKNSRIVMTSFVRDTERYAECSSDEQKNSAECKNRNPNHEHDTFNVNCELKPQDQTVSCSIRNIHHAIGHRLVYRVFEQLVSSTCSMITETLTLAGKVITNVTYAANPQNSQPFILGQFTQRVVFEPLRKMTVQADDSFSQLLRTKYPQIVISPNLPTGLPATCDDLAQASQP